MEIHVDFYVAAATVLPLLLLGLVWDSHYLEEKLPRRSKFTKWFVLTVGSCAIVVTVLTIALCLAVLADVWHDARWTKGAVGAGVAIAMVILTVRACTDTVKAALGAIRNQPGGAVDSIDKLKDGALEAIRKSADRAVEAINVVESISKSAEGAAESIDKSAGDAVESITKSAEGGSWGNRQVGPRGGHAFLVGA